jgi:hypothetical protein
VGVAGGDGDGDGTSSELGGGGQWAAARLAAVRRGGEVYSLVGLSCGCNAMQWAVVHYRPVYIRRDRRAQCDVGADDALSLPTHQLRRLVLP